MGSFLLDHLILEAEPIFTEAQTELQRFGSWSPYVAKDWARGYCDDLLMFVVHPRNLT